LVACREFQQQLRKSMNDITSAAPLAPAQAATASTPPNYKIRGSWRPAHR
jgi:hypothetical protein